MNLIILLPLPSATFTCVADGKWKSNHNDVETPSCIPGLLPKLILNLGLQILGKYLCDAWFTFVYNHAVCGRPTNYISAYQRIIGGSEAPQHTIPWQVLLAADGERAGGMVIADRWILTGATVVVHNGVKVPDESVFVSTAL